MVVFKNYFSSTKRNSNTATGCLGLGSKTPFCYSDNWNVTAIFDGVKRDYIAFKDDEGIPNFAMVPGSECVTHLPNGVRIEFAVDAGDCYKFEMAARTALEFISPAPQFMNSDVYCSVKEADYKIESDGWAFRDSGGARSTGDSYVIMGHIAYPIDPDKLDEQYNRARTIYGNPIDIFVNLDEIPEGEFAPVNFLPNRESLQYNKKTKEFLIAKAEQIGRDAGKMYEEEMKACQSLWQARVKFAELDNSGSYIARLSKGTKKDHITWRGQKIFETMDFNLWIKEIDEDDVAIEDGISVTTVYKDGWRETIRNENSTRIRVSGKTKIFLNDSSRSIKKVSHELETNDYGRGGRLFLVKLDEDNFPDCKQTLMDKLGMIEGDLYLTSTLYDPPIVTSSGYDRVVRSKVCTLNRGKYNETWTDTTVDVKDGGIYVEINRYKAVNCETASYHNPDYTYTICRMLEQLETAGAAVPVIYGVKTAVLKQKRFKNANWTKFFDYFDDAKVKVLDQVDLVAKVERHHALETLFKGAYDGSMSRIDLGKISDLLEEGHFLKEFLEDAEFPDFNEQMEVVRKWMNSAHHNWENDEMIKREKELYTKYPVLSLVKRTLQPEDASILATYVIEKDKVEA